MRKRKLSCAEAVAALEIVLKFLIILLEFIEVFCRKHHVSKRFNNKANNAYLPFFLKNDLNIFRVYAFVV
jgi:hypothetical protein